MPRFNFEILSAARTVHDHHGMIFVDCGAAARFATEMAAELSTIRPELNDQGLRGDDG